MNKKPNSVLDVLARIEDLESRLKKIDEQKFQSSEMGYISLVKDPVLSKEGAGKKIVTKTILFDEPFKEAPKLLPSITAFNLDRDQEARLEVNVDHVDATGAKITIRTWRESRAYYVRVDWLAIGVR